MNNRSRFVSAIQKKVMLKYLRRNPELVSSKFSSDFSVKDAQTKWSEMSRMLNRLPGSRKDWKHWRKTWHDIRSKTKLKHLQGSSVFTLTPSERDILNLIGELNYKEDVDAGEETMKIENGTDESDSELNISQYLSAENKSEPLDFGKNHNKIIFQVMPLDSAGAPDMEDPLVTMSSRDDGINLEESGGVEVDVEDADFFREVDQSVEAKPKETYHELKLKILQRIAVAKERSAAAKQRIATALEKIAGSRASFV